MNYTLRNYYEEAGVTPVPEWASEIILWNKDKNEPMRPRWHQVTGLNLTFAYANQRSGLFDEMGTGKTLPAQAWAIWHAWAGNRTVMLMPPILLGQFMSSLRATFKGIEKYVRSEIYHGPKKKRDKTCARWYAEGPPGIVVTTYDMFRDEFMMFDGMFQFQCLGMDEARMLSNEENKTTIAINQFMGKEGEKASLVMNGTPSSNSLVDLYGLIRFITPQTYPNRMAFDRKHVIYQQVSVRTGKRGQESMRDMTLIGSFKNHADLYDNLYLQARRVEKQEVLELPAKNVIFREFELSDKHRQTYDQLVKERLLLFPDDSMIDATASSTLRNLCIQGVVHPDMYKLDEVSKVFDMCDELLEEIGLGDTKVLILCHFRQTVERVAERYKKHKPATIYGGNTASQNEKSKNMFLEDKECRVAVVNYLSGGVGLNFQSVCHNVICFEPTTVPASWQQATDRVHRSGQDKPVNVYMLIAKGTIFVKATSNLFKKIDEIASVVSKAQLQAELIGSDDLQEGVADSIENW